jgi:hypothetical protein
MANEMAGPKKDLIFQGQPFQWPRNSRTQKRLYFQGRTLPIALEMAGPKKSIDLQASKSLRSAPIKQYINSNTLAKKG